MPKRSAKESKPLKTTKKLKTTEEEDNGVDSGIDTKAKSDLCKTTANETNEECSRVSSIGSKFNKKIMSWNVAGLRALLKKNRLKDFETEDADIVCLQEVKCQQKDIPEEINVWAKYKYKYYNLGEKPGYSGVCLFSKEKPLQVKNGIGLKEHDSEGRVITAEFPDFYLVTTYVPNSGRGLVRLDYRQKWNNDFDEYLIALKAKKGVILCGDLNVSHKEIDLENPKTNTKTAGFTAEEREDFTRFLSKGFVDSFRHFYPNDKKCYTYWSYFRNARDRDIGWRLDYFVVSEQLMANICDNQIRKQIKGSDHCPILLYLSI
ncbi:unnamed protein product [Medioppia subpectinata]|uniref:DNA repair nuclease/redox regulator APEX1 n=1 Tax=Medioppia subpectinata TaxID=1979941 RepID=A0A7R9KB80_9ACAR|nr:unnamed protein product [Medioppia subpectinata]CAG2100217.1 unnamed protein product [Medioppia subpectinata]